MLYFTKLDNVPGAGAFTYPCRLTSQFATLLPRLTRISILDAQDEWGEWATTSSVCSFTAAATAADAVECLLPVLCMLGKFPFISFSAQNTHALAGNQFE